MLTPEAIEAAAADLFERTALPMRRCREVSETALAAALPHLLADYRERLVTAAAELAAKADTSAEMDNAYFRVIGKEQGVKLSLSYLDEMLRS